MNGDALAAVSEPWPVPSARGRGKWAFGSRSAVRSRPKPLLPTALASSCEPEEPRAFAQFTTSIARRNAGSR
jgi:hypothetical protein